MLNYKRESGLSNLLVIIIALVVIGGIGAVLLMSKNQSGNQQPSPATQAGYYNNPSIGVSLNYPSGWTADTKMTSTSVIQAIFGKGTDADVRVLLPAVSTNNQQQWVTDYKQLTTKNSGVTSFEEDSDTTINRVTFHKLAWSTKLSEGTPVKTIALLTVANGKEYSFTANVKSSMYDTLLPDINSILNSIVVR